MRLLWSIFAQTGVALKLTANRRFVDTDLVCDGALLQTRFLQRINLVTITLSEAVIAFVFLYFRRSETLGHRCLMHHTVGKVALQS
jgi:hypothetical protein